MPDELTDIAERLLAGCYHNPEQVAPVAAEGPIMPDAATDKLWDEMEDLSGPNGFDPARLSSRLGMSGDGAPVGDSAEAKARDLLRRIRGHDVLGPVEATSYGHKGDQLQEWASQLADEGQKNRLATRLGTLVSKIQQSGPELTMEEIRSGLISEIQEATQAASDHGLKHVSEFIEEAKKDVDAWERGEMTDYIPTGFYGLDEKITGVPIGELTIFAAPSGAGKTSWLLQLLRQVAIRDQDQAVCFFSIEMPAKKVVHRAAAAWKGGSLNRVQQRPETIADNGQTHGDKHRKALDALKQLPLYVDQDPEPTIGEIYSRVMQVQATKDVALVGVDYDEKVDPDDAPPSEEQRVAAISKGLKTLAKETESACVALSQYNSAPSSQVRPGTNDDLRYSRKKKHEAHTILHWYWPAYWLRSGDVDPNAGDEFPDHYNPQKEERGRLYIGKDRDGGPGWIELDFHAERTRFLDPKDPEYDDTAPF
jgi:replicative DNA helicase